MRHRTRSYVNPVEFRAVITAFYILVATLILVIAGLVTLAYAFSGVNPNSSEVAEHFTSDVPTEPTEGVQYVTQGDELRTVYQVGENTFTAASCTIAATGVDQDGVTTILTARHCISDDPLRILDRIEIGSWSGDFEILSPTTDSDYMFIRVHGLLGIGGSESIQNDYPIGIKSVCRQGYSGDRSLVCARAWLWDKMYISTADCHFGDSGGPLTSTNRSELVGVVSAMVVPRPGVRLCRSVPTATIVDDIESGRVPGLDSFTLTGAQ